MVRTGAKWGTSSAYKASIVQPPSGGALQLCGPSAATFSHFLENLKVWIFI